MKQSGVIEGGNGITWEQFFMLDGKFKRLAVARGWKPNDRQRRLAVFSEALGRTVASAKELSWADDVDAVKQHLDKLAAAPERRPSISAATSNMLALLFRNAVREHCRRATIDRITAAEVEELRAEWTRAAIGRDIRPTWTWETALNGKDVDLLKPFLIWKADLDNEDKRAAFATARVDGRTRNIIAAIWANATTIRQLEALADPSRAAELLTDASINQYIVTVTDRQRDMKNWRALLLPCLEDHLLVTVENRKRAAIERAVDAGLCSKETYGRVRVAIPPFPWLHEYFSAQQSRTAVPAVAHSETETGETPVPHSEAAFVPFEDQF